MVVDYGGTIHGKHPKPSNLPNVFTQIHSNKPQRSHLEGIDGLIYISGRIFCRITAILNMVCLTVFCL